MFICFTGVIVTTGNNRYSIIFGLFRSQSISAVSKFGESAQTVHTDNQHIFLQLASHNPKFTSSFYELIGQFMNSQFRRVANVATRGQVSVSYSVFAQLYSSFVTMVNNVLNNGDRDCKPMRTGHVVALITTTCCMHVERI